MAQAHYFRKGKPLFSTTLVTGIGTGTSDTITLSSVAGLPTDTEITLTFDRVDQNGDALPAADMERITGIIVDSNFTAYTRAIEGTERAHLSGCVIEYIPCEQDQNDLIDGLLVEHLQTGRHSLTSPKVTTSINDSNGNEIIKTPATASAVNELTITNAATGNAPVISATGGDTNIDLNITPKGTGMVGLTNAKNVHTVATYAPEAAATATIDLSLANVHRITMPAGNITIAISNEVAGRYFVIEIVKDNSATVRTITWMDTVTWISSGGTAPALTTTANGMTTYGFRVTGTDTYDGYLVGSK